MTQSFEHSSAVEPIRAYFHRIRQILFTPRRFFREMPVRGGISGPLAFALVTHWLAIGAHHFWVGVIGEKILPFWGRLLGVVEGEPRPIDSLGRLPWFDRSRDLVTEWFWGAGKVLIDPFFTLGKLAVLSLVFFVAARVVVSAQLQTRRPVTFEAVLRILCYATAADLVLALPIIGSPLDWFARFCLVVVGFLEFYGIGIARALVIALFPYLLVIGTICLATLGSIALAIRLLTGV